MIKTKLGSAVLLLETLGSVFLSLVAPGVGRSVELSLIALGSANLPLASLWISLSFTGIKHWKVIVLSLLALGSAILPLASFGGDRSFTGSARR